MDQEEIKRILQNPKLNPSMEGHIPKAPPPVGIQAPLPPPPLKSEGDKK